ncbi:MAG: porin, partial [Gammaproteobacteria bacterium]|nr:porin [Gammaproteobacteria bacterium]
MKVVGQSARLMMAALLAAGAWHGARAEDATRSFEIYGFVQADYIQDTKRVDPNWQDAFRPSRIATPEGQFGSNGQASVSVKQSRFGVKGAVPTSDHAPPINFKFEFDFFGTGVDAGQTTIRLRHFYGEWGQLLAGQTHSLFMDIDVFPNVIDYWGPTGMVFLRLPQIRWTAYRTANDVFAFALERPGNDVDPGNLRLAQGFENAEVRADQPIPDLTGQFRHDDTWGHYQISAILRRVGYEYSLTGEPFQKGSQTGWGVNLATAIKMMEKDQLLLQVVHGDGIASYMNDGGMDIAPQTAPAGPPGSLGVGSKAVPLTGVVAYYDHYWNPTWSSSIGYSFTQVQNTDFQTASTYHKGQYASVNLLMYPADKVMIGGELMWGKRTNNDG